MGVALGVAAFVAVLVVVWFTSRPTASERLETPADLREALFAAVRRGDRARLDALCRGNEQAIVDAFPGWARRDPALGPPDPGELEAMIQFLGTVAEHMRTLGRDEPWTRLTAPKGGNPITAWERDLERAREELDDTRPEACVERLLARLEKVRTLRGSALDELLPVTHGTLGAGQFHLGRFDDAARSFGEALRRCEARDDAAGVRAYRAGLYEVERHRENRDAAADHADALAQIALDAGERADGERWAAAAVRVRRGEPRARLVARIGERAYELDALPQAPPGTRIHFDWVRDRISLRAAETRTKAGVARAEAGDLDGALAKWREATAVDPSDPDPRYQSAVALLQLGRWEEAEAALAETERVAPGWFLTRHYAWLAKERRAGRLDAGSVDAVLRTLDDAPGSPAAKVELAREALTRAPGFEWMHVLLARALRSRGDRAEAEAHLRQALPALREPCFESDACLELAITIAPGDERDALLLRAIERAGSPMSTAGATLVRRQDAT